MSEFLKHLGRNVWPRSWFSLETGKYKFKCIYCKLRSHISCIKWRNPQKIPIQKIQMGSSVILHMHIICYLKLWISWNFYINNQKLMKIFSNTFLQTRHCTNLHALNNKPMSPEHFVLPMFFLGNPSYICLNFSLGV